MKNVGCLERTVQCDMFEKFLANVKKIRKTFGLVKASLEYIQTHLIILNVLFQYDV